MASINDTLKQVISLLQSLLVAEEPIIITAPEPRYIPSDRNIAWSNKVSDTFIDRVLWICSDLHLDPDDLMSCMAWESGESFSASVKNAAGSGAVGLIQFMPSTAKALKTSTLELAAMTAEDQLRYVYRYFEPLKGRLHNLGDIYMAILWPRGIGKSDDEVLFKAGALYKQNAGLDINKDHLVTRGECIAKVLQKKTKGMQPGNTRAK